MPLLGPLSLPPFSFIDTAPPHIYTLSLHDALPISFTPFLWAFQERERIYNLQEMWTGARLTTSVTRVGGMMADVPDDFVAGLRHFTRTFPKTLSEIDRVLTRNAVWVGRTQGVGVLTAGEAINHSLSGPMLRASGVAYDVRK